MLSWNCLKRLVWPSLSVAQMKRVIRSSILLFGALATVLALKVQSVQALWFFTSDLVFVLLFPQLLFALFDPKANRTGSIVAFAVSLVLAGRRRRAAARPAGVHSVSRDRAVQDARGRGRARPAAARVSRRPRDGMRRGRCATSSPRRRRSASCARLLAWLVHLYTAMGLVCAAGMAVLIVRGDDASFRGAFLLMMVATAIDATDGWLARKARVKEVLPGFDGARARQPDRLSDLHDAAAAPDLARRPAAGRPRVALAAPAARQRLRLLAGQREDRRRLLPRIPVVLEHRRVLSLRVPAAAVGVGRADRRRARC